MVGCKFSEIYETLDKACKESLNVLMISTHGVGKTYVTDSLFKKNFKKWLYFSAATLDPYIDLIGVPTPKTKEDGSLVLDFARPDIYQGVEAIFFDEISRAHHKVLNALMELIQFKSINGLKLPELKVVWGATNPPDAGYYTDRLDPAIESRFNLKFCIKPSVSEKYFLDKGYSHSEVTTFCAWWNSLPDTAKDLVPPRTLENIMHLNSIHIPMSSAFLPEESEVPLASLSEALANAKTIQDRLGVPLVHIWSVSGNAEAIINALDSLSKDIGTKKFKHEDASQLEIQRVTLERSVMNACNNNNNCRKSTVTAVFPVLMHISKELVKPFCQQFASKIDREVIDADKDLSDFFNGLL